MTSRGHPGRAVRHVGSGSGALQYVDASLPPELAEKKLAVEVERLASENHRLATAQIVLRRDLVSAQDEIQTVKAHMRSIQTESDIQIRVLLEKIAKMEADCKNAENFKNELEQAHKEAQRLVVVRQEIVDEIEKAKKELNSVQSEVKQLPDMLSVLDSMREEHHRLRSSFDYEKDVNLRKVEQLKAMDRELLGMSTEAERLQTEVANAEKSLETPTAETPTMVSPYGVPFQNSDISHQPPAIQNNGPYYHPYSVTPIHMGAFPVDGTIRAPPTAIPPLPANPPVDEMIPPPPANPPSIPPPPANPPSIPPPPADETIPPPPPTPFEETIPPPPPYDPPA